MIVECRPPVLVAARYDDLPFPSLQPMQEVAFDVGVTATDRPLELRGMVVQGYNDHQLIFEQHWPGRIMAQRLGSSDLAIAPGTGLALRGLHFMAPGYEPLTHIDVTDPRTSRRARDRCPAFGADCRCASTSSRAICTFRCAARGGRSRVRTGPTCTSRRSSSQTYATDFVRLGPDNRFFAGDGHGGRGALQLGSARLCHGRRQDCCRYLRHARSQARRAARPAHVPR